MNNVTVRPHVDATDVRDKIEAAFRRSAEIDAAVTLSQGLLGGTCIEQNARVGCEACGRLMTSLPCAVNDP